MCWKNSNAECTSALAAISPQTAAESYQNKVKTDTHFSDEFYCYPRTLVETVRDPTTNAMKTEAAPFTWMKKNTNCETTALQTSCKANSPAADLLFFDHECTTTTDECVAKSCTTAKVTTDCPGTNFCNSDKKCWDCATSADCATGWSCNSYKKGETYTKAERDVKICEKVTCTVNDDFSFYKEAKSDAKKACFMKEGKFGEEYCNESTGKCADKACTTANVLETCFKTGVCKTDKCAYCTASTDCTADPAAPTCVYLKDSAGVNDKT